MGQIFTPRGKRNAYKRGLKFPGNIIAKVYSIIAIFFVLAPRAAIYFLLSINRADVGIPSIILLKIQRGYSPATFKVRDTGNQLWQDC